MPKKKISRDWQLWSIPTYSRKVVYNTYILGSLPIPKTRGQSQSRSLQCQGGNDFILLNWMPDPIKYRWADSAFSRELRWFQGEQTWMSFTNGFGERDWIRSYIHTGISYMPCIYIYIYICIIKCIQLQYARTMFNILPRLHITKRDIRNGLTLQG